MELGMIPAMVGRITFTGDLGYEIWVRSDYLLALYDLLTEAGADLGLRLFGGRALDSLRLEKNWGTWAREYRPLYTPFEACLDRFVDLKKNDFVGRDAALKANEAGNGRRLTTLVVDADDADVGGDEPILLNDEVVGWVTSGGYAHHAGASVAMGYMPGDLAASNASFEVEIMGVPRGARVQAEPLFDPKAERMRG
jgi:dimethylglycine dehydrogenase